MSIKCPSHGRYLFDWYMEISTGTEALNVLTLVAWQELTSIELNQWEIDTLRRIDVCRRNIR